MCMDVVSELSYHEYVEAIQRDLTKTHSGDHRNDGTLRIYPVHMIWNETGRTVRHHPYRLLSIIHFAYGRRFSVVATATQPRSRSITTMGSELSSRPAAPSHPKDHKRLRQHEDN